MENDNTSKYPVSISIKSPSSDPLFNYCTENSVLMLLLWLHVIAIVVSICYYQLHIGYYCWPSVVDGTGCLSPHAFFRPLQIRKVPVGVHGVLLTPAQRIAVCVGHRHDPPGGPGESGQIEDMVWHKDVYIVYTNMCDAYYVMIYDMLIITQFMMP